MEQAPSFVGEDEPSKQSWREQYRDGGYEIEICKNYSSSNDCTVNPDAIVLESSFTVIEKCP
jgi:hypothetical protein